MPKFRLFIHFDAGYADHSEIVEYEDIDEAKEDVKIQAEELLSYGVVRICDLCDEECEDDGSCDECGTASEGK